MRDDADRLCFLCRHSDPFGGGLGIHKSSLSDLVTLHVTIQFEALFAIDDAPFDRYVWRRA